MPTKRHCTSVIVTIANCALILSGCAHRWPTDKYEHGSPLEFHLADGSECIPYSLNDVDECLWKADHYMKPETRWQEAKRLVLEKNPHNGTPPWCEPPYGNVYSIQQCSRAWRIPDEKPWEAEESKRLLAEEQGPPKPDDPKPGVACKGFNQCQKSFAVHHPHVAGELGFLATAAVAVGVWTLLGLLKKKDRHPVNNGPTVCMNNCPGINPACEKYYQETPAEQKIFGKPQGC